MAQRRERPEEGRDDGLPDELLRYRPEDWPDEPDPMMHRVAFLRARQAWETKHNRCGPWRQDDLCHYGISNFVSRCTCRYAD